MCTGLGFEVQCIALLRSLWCAVPRFSLVSALILTLNSLKDMGEPTSLAAPFPWGTLPRRGVPGGRGLSARGLSEGRATAPPSSSTPFGRAPRGWSQTRVSGLASSGTIVCIAALARFHPLVFLGGGGVLGGCGGVQSRITPPSNTIPSAANCVAHVKQKGLHTT